MKFRKKRCCRVLIAVSFWGLAGLARADAFEADGPGQLVSPSTSGSEADEKQTNADGADKASKKENGGTVRPSKSDMKKAREAWVKRYQGAVKKLKTAPADEVAKIEEMILTTREADALGPMVEVLGRESAPIRLLLDRSLAANRSEMAWSALAERLLIEPDPEVRRGILKLVEKEPDAAKVQRLLSMIKRALSDKNQVRAALGAQAAAELGWREMVPLMIEQVAPVRSVRGVTWEPEPVSAGAQGLSVGSIDGYVVVPVPVVGPGVVAYGQQIIPYGSGLSLGSPGGTAPKYRPVMRAGPQVFPNPAVQRALVELSGVDYGYDMMLWRNWLKESFRLDDQPRKRVLVP